MAQTRPVASSGAAAITTVPGMPGVPDPTNLYSETVAGKLSPAVAGALPRVYVPNRRANTVSVPIRGANRGVVAALTVCVPTSRASPERKDRIVRDLIASGERISQSVGWLPAWNATRGEVHSPPLPDDA